MCPITAYSRVVRGQNLLSKFISLSIFACVALLLVPAVSVADSVALLRDINLTGRSSNPSDAILIQSKLFFTSGFSRDGAHGNEPWVSEGTPASTRLVKDIYPGVAGSNPRQLFALGNSVLFVANDGIHGCELWRSDGTESGTNLVKDIVQDSLCDEDEDLRRADPTGFVVNGSFAYFIASPQGISGDYKLWRTDGTSEGTVELSLPEQCRLPTDLTPLGSEILFAGGDADRTLCKINTQTGVVSFVRDIPLYDYYNFGGSPFPVLEGKIFFAAQVDGSEQQELWTSDGTAAGTRSLATFDSALYLGGSAVFAGKLYFEGSTGANGTEVWATDGTSAGTRLVKDIVPGPDSSDPSQFFAAAGQLFFKASETAFGTELWKTDGSEAGTVRVRDIFPGDSGSDPSGFSRLGNSLLFFAEDPDHGRELWVSDGTGAGTHLVVDLITGLEGVSSPRSGESLFVDGARAYFFDVSTIGRLLRTDGTSSGTQLVTELPVPGTVDSFPGDFFESSGVTLFLAEDSEGHVGLYKISGSTGEVTLVRQMPATTRGRFARHISLPTPFQGVTYFLFNSFDENSSFSLWRTDGTGAGTQLVEGSGEVSSMTPMGEALLFFKSNEANEIELRKIVGVGEPSVLLATFDHLPDSTYLTVVGSNAFFTACTANFGCELWTTNGTTEGTKLVKDLTPGINDSPLNDVRAIGNRIVFFLDNGSSPPTLYVSDGTEAGTVPLVDLEGYLQAVSPPALGGIILFSESSDVVARLWRSDGTAAGTSIVKEFPVTDGYFFLDNFYPALGKVFFSSSGDNSRRNVWVSDGTEVGTNVVANVINFSPLGLAGSLLYFDDFFYDGLPGSLWRSDGTSLGTFVVKATCDASQVKEFQGAAYFSARTERVGRELWRTNGTISGTELVADVFPGQLSGLPYSTQLFSQTGVNSRLYFAADDGAHGFEPWSVAQVDLCPNDPNKVGPGLCGCGVSDLNSAGQPNCDSSGLLPTPTPTPTAASTATPTVTPTVTPTFTPTATSTIIPLGTSTPNPTQTPTGTPSASPTVTSVSTSTPVFTSTPAVTPLAIPQPPKAKLSLKKHRVVVKMTERPGVAYVIMYSIPAKTKKGKPKVKTLASNFATVTLPKIAIGTQIKLTYHYRLGGVQILESSESPESKIKVR